MTGLHPSPMLAPVAVFVGAGCGALLRWRLSLWLNPASPTAASWPLGTLAANLLGGYLIGLALGLLQAQTQIDPIWRLLIMTGFLGGLTTFSTFSAEILTALLQGRVMLALAQACAHMAGSLLLSWLGLMSARLIQGH